MRKWLTALLALTFVFSAITQAEVVVKPDVLEDFIDSFNAHVFRDELKLKLSGITLVESSSNVDGYVYEINPYLGIYIEMQKSEHNISTIAVGYYKNALNENQHEELLGDFGYLSSSLVQAVRDENSVDTVLDVMLNLDVSNILENGGAQKYMLNGDIYGVSVQQEADLTLYMFAFAYSPQ